MKDIPKTIYYTCAIHSFTIYAQYLLNNNETHFYKEHDLYNLDKMKIVLENHHLINVKQF